jgi:hypothetical protein
MEVRHGELTLRVIPSLEYFDKLQFKWPEDSNHVDWVQQKPINSVQKESPVRNPRGLKDRIYLAEQNNIFPESTSKRYIDR